MTDDGVRKMAERWWIHVCPECNGLVGERSQTHNETCPYRAGDAMFVVRSVEVTPAADELLQAARWVVKNWDQQATQHASMAALRRAVQCRRDDYQPPVIDSSDAR